MKLLTVFMMCLLFCAGISRAEQTVSGLKGWVSAAAFDPEGKFLLTLSGADTFSGLNPATLKTEFVFRLTPGENITSFSLAPDGKTALCAGDAGTVTLVSLPDGALLFQEKAHNRPVKSAVISPDGRYFATGAYGGEVVLWDAVSHSKIKTITNEAEIGEIIVFVSSAVLAAAGSADKQLYLYDIPSGLPLKTLAGHPTGMTSLAVSPNGRLIASGDSYGTIVIRDTEDWKTRKIIRDDFWEVSALAFSPDSRFLAAARNDGRISIYTAADYTCVRTLLPYIPGALACAFSPDGSLLAAGYMLGALKLYDWRTAEVFARQPGAAIKKASGKTAGRLKAKTAYRADFADSTPYGVKITRGKMSAYVSPDALYDTDRIAPLIMPFKADTAENAVRIEFAVLDDVQIGPVTVNGKPAAPGGPSPYKCGNLRSCETFLAEFPPSDSVRIDALDITGKSTSTVFTANTIPPDAGPYFMRGRAAEDIPLHANRAGLRLDGVIKKDAPIDTAGYKKGWYYLRDGSWIYDSSVIAR